MAIKVWCNPDEVTERTLLIIKVCGAEFTSKRRGKLIWACADEPAKYAVDFRKYEWPREDFTICFGPDLGDAEPLIKPEDDRITIPGLPHAIFADQAMAIILYNLVEQ